MAHLKNIGFFLVINDKKSPTEVTFDINRSEKLHFEEPSDVDWFFESFFVGFGYPISAVEKQISNTL
jgi:hypothetical protein